MTCPLTCEMVSGALFKKVRLDLGRGEGVVVEGHVLRARVAAKKRQVTALADNFVFARHTRVAIDSLGNVSRRRSRDQSSRPPR